MKYSIHAFQQALLEWFADSARDLPWRRTKNPYYVYISEIILQQTRVEQGLPYYERFVQQFPTLELLAKASEQQVLKVWEGLGYYSRARNMHRTARVIIEKYAGKFPGDPEVLQLLPGIGRYTAGAIASIAFDIPTPVVDGNVKRVLARLDAVMEPFDQSGQEKLFWERATGLTPAMQPGDFNQAMMELGARICTPQSPKCPFCPVQKYCSAYSRGIQESLPVRSPRKTIPHHYAAIAAIRKKECYLIGLRPSEGFLGGLWEFPGGKIMAGENPQQALLRTCSDELGIAVKVGGLIAVVNHAYTHFKITMNVFACTIQKGKPKPKVHNELRWVAPEHFSQYPFPKGAHKFLHLLPTKNT